MNNYFSLKKEDIFKILESSEKGLSDIQVKKRLKQYGKNVLKEKDKRNIFLIFFSQFKSPFILILIFATFLAFFLGEHLDAFVILGIILISSLLGFYQEYKSERALEALKKYISFKVKVLREGKEKEIDSREIVPGDIVYLSIGDIVPADIRIIEEKDFYVREAEITGESYPVKKTAMEIKEKNLPITKQLNMVFMGSEVAEGHATGIVVSTGKNTYLGKIAEMLSSKHPPTDFQKGIKNFGEFLIKIIFILTFLVFSINFVLNKGFISSFLFALAIAVGITPELLPIIITVSLSNGAIKMAKKKVIVKKLISIEDLGNMDVLCIDKTGTLTENEIKVIDFFDFNKKRNEKIIQYATICNFALSYKNKIIGNFFDKAILEYSNIKKINIPSYEKIQEIEFDHKRKRMSKIIKIENKILLISKGEPLSILEKCNRIEINNKIYFLDKYKEKIIETFKKLSHKGLRVIAISYKEIGLKKDYDIKDESNLIFLGFIVFSDPPKKDVKEIFKKFKKLGVDVKIITGDNEFVTEEICKQTGFKIKGKIISGDVLENLSEEEFLKIIEENNVFVRVIPEQKLKIVQGLQKKGHVTGFLGDGINDSIALKFADVGLTVDNAVDIAKKSSDIILLRKSLEVICEGIIEGRKTFGNSTKYILNTMSANFGNMFSLSVASLYFKFIPLLPKQVLLVNFISDLPLLTISNDNVDEEYLKKPRGWDINLIKNFMIFFGLISSLFDILTMMFVWFLIAPENPKVFRTVWFVESVLSEILVTFAIRTKKFFWKSKPSKLLVFASIIGIIITILSIYLTKMRLLFEFEYLHFYILLIIFCIIILYIILVEIGKKIFYSKIIKEN